MKELKDAQELLRSTIADYSYFSGKTVIADVGLSKDAIEIAVNNSGFCVVVDLPIACDLMQRGPGVSECNVTFPVHVQVNPTVNAANGGAGVNVLEAIDSVCSAVLGYEGTDSTDRFEHEEKPFELVVNDAGLLAYVIWFRTMITLAATA